MFDELDRRDFLKLAGLGGVVFASGLGFTRTAAAASQDFYFVQLSDSHWGFKGAAVNPEAEHTLQRAVTAVNALQKQPDFIVFTGDLTHTTDDDQERRQRMAQFKQIVGALKVKDVHFMPGEHDASLDAGKAYQEFFGPTHYSFDHKGIHFIALDNVSDPQGAIGSDQLGWLRADLKPLKQNQPVVVLAHRPLFDLQPDWDWATKDGNAAIDILMPYQNVSVFYGHIHQEHHQNTGHISHHAATSLMFPLPAPGSQPKRAPVPWDAAQPFRGLGFREVEATGNATSYEIMQRPIA
ncbi:MAG TPA: metallophosphoesterase [Alphaproteobacteria bacterium]